MNSRVTTRVKNPPSETKYAAPSFMKYSSPDIAKDAPGETALLSGNEALARGCIEAGVRVGACFPGSPVTYTLDNLVEAARVYPSMHVEWSVNEKVAYEVALGAALTGVRAMCVFKNVGLDVALDAVANSAVNLGPGGLVLIINDDPGQAATQSEVDIRYLAMFSSIPILEPSTMQEVKDYAAAAFGLSERLHLPVLVRPMYAQAYARERVVLGEIQHDVRERSPHYDARDWRPPEGAQEPSLHKGTASGNWAHARFHGEVPAVGRELAKGWPNLVEVQAAIESFAGNKLTINEKCKIGVIGSGMAFREAMEALKALGRPDEVATLKLATTYPLPVGLVKRLLEQTETVLVTEEIEPFIEDQVRSLSAGMDTHARILGKVTGDIPVTGELQRDQIGPALGRLLGREYQGEATAERLQLGRDLFRSLGDLPSDVELSRQCPGCPGRAAAYALEQACEHLGILDSTQFFGYDGCCGGVPVGKMDIKLCMGAGANLAAGMYHAGLKGKQIALCGDSNFFHAFVPGLAEAIYNKSDLLIYVQDNGTTAMTGHQPHPSGFGVTATGQSTKILDIAEIAKAFQVDFLAVVDPYDQQQTFDALVQALATKGVSVVVSRRACAVVAQRQKGARDAMIFDQPSQIDRGKCLAWTVEMAPCEARCPINQDVEGYVKAIANGDFPRALAIIRETNPFPGICGRVCNHPCEAACKRGKLDEPVAIRSLKRFAADYELRNGRAKPTPFLRTRPEEIAIVGAGPAGLTAGYDLAKAGYGVTVFEASSIPGGMLVNGIPEFVLPRAIVQDEIGYLEDAGVKIKTGVALGRDFTLSDLRKQGCNAIFLAIGAQKGGMLGIPGEELKGVLSAVDFLRQVAGGQQVDLGQRVVVVGGGFTALDAARTALRLGSKDVSIAYRRSRAEMPAGGEDMAEAEREGVSLHYLAAPVRILGEEGRVTGIECQRMRLGPVGEDGRRTFEPVPDSSFVLNADSVVVAIGQRVDLAASDLATTRQGAIAADAVTLATNLPGIFSGGDAVRGGGTVVEAIAMGHEAAISIERYLDGRDLREGRVARHPVTGADILPDGVLHRSRQEMPMLTADVRKQGFAEVEVGFIQEQAMAEARRCLRCKVCRRCIDDFNCMAMIPENGRPTVDLSLCAGCNVCIQVCPYGYIEEVEASK